MTVPTSILANDISACGNAAKITVVKQPANGVISSFARVQRRADPGIFTYAPNDPNAPVSDSFDYKITCNGLEVCSRLLFPVSVW
jgi:hypothetical protein